MSNAPSLRFLGPQDSLSDLTELLHRAYAGLADMGLNYTATDQTVETTRYRCAEGETWVADLNGALVGTITLSPPALDEDVPLYREPDVAHFQQFGVEPALQGSGIGACMMAHVERRAAELGYHRLACDTAEPAERLVHWYESLGYWVEAHHQWRGKTYRSVILVKRIVGAGLE